ncbi:immunoglobulin domain-containing protein, partial [Tenacibaculum holothuriorum]|uniref:immunoglobulin domain-containing protein n=1 Tax=Tenacibaculum holothuriorum TaxID=1635173 RepID=UPI000A32652F
LKIENNNFIFGDFEDEFNQYKNLNTFTYSPQDKFDEIREENVKDGEGFKLTSTVFGETVSNSTNNSYQWYKDGGAIDGAVNKTYSIASMSPSDAGVYNLKVTNSTITNLELVQQNITINYSNTSHPDYNALKALYDSANGDNWTHKWDLNSPISNWHGVRLENNRVVELWLSDNNIVGTIPTEISELSEIKILDISLNELSGIIPDELFNLTNLTHLVIGANKLSGEISPNISALSNLKEISLNKNQLTGVIPVELGALTNLTSLNLSENLLTGEIPGELGSLTKLGLLYLWGNQLT